MNPVTCSTLLRSEKSCEWKATIVVNLASSIRTKYGVSSNWSVATAIPTFMKARTLEIFSGGQQCRKAGEGQQD